MNAARLTAIADDMMRPEFAMRLSRLRAAIDRAGESGLDERQASEILKLPVPVFRVVAAYVRASQVETHAHRIAAQFPMVTMQ